MMAMMLYRNEFVFYYIPVCVSWSSIRLYLSLSHITIVLSMRLLVQENKWLPQCSTHSLASAFDSNYSSGSAVGLAAVVLAYFLLLE
jgi:Na+/H+-translocating membrane pyrophosphatase